MKKIVDIDFYSLSRWIMLGVAMLAVSAYHTFGQASSIVKPRSLLVLQPLGIVRQKDIIAAKTGILAMYDLEVKVAEPLPLPDLTSSYAQPRYRAEKLLSYLAATVKAKCLKVVGLTAEDMSTTHGEIADHRVLGLGDIYGKTCVVSTYQIGLGKSRQAEVHERLVKIVNHEIGHTFGLKHCSTPGCLMQDTRGNLQTVDKETGDFCPNCRARLGRVLHARPSQSYVVK